jgi:hypothetical protein
MENCQARLKIAKSGLESLRAAQKCLKWYRGLHPGRGKNYEKY